MNHRLTIAEILTAVLIATGSAVAMAQQPQHTMGAAASTPDMAAAMAQAIAAMQAGNAQLEELTTKMNAATGQAKMAAMADLLTALVKQRKTDLETMKAMHDRAASQPSDMAGMSHGMGMHMSGATDPKPAASPAPTSIDIVLRTQPDPLRTGDNTFEVTVKDAHGQAVTDAVVTVNLFMAAMPSMGMPAMRSAAKLTHASNGVYRGTGQVSMAGRWEVTISAARAGTEIGSKKLTVTAR